jgi:hypothetical protein
MKTGLAPGSGSSHGWAHIGLLEFFRAREAIEEGNKSVQRMLPEIHHIFGRAGNGLK